MSGNSVAEAAYYKRQLDDLKKVGENAALYEKALKHSRDLYAYNCALTKENFGLRQEIARLRDYIAAMVPHSTGTTPMIQYTY